LSESYYTTRQDFLKGLKDWSIVQGVKQDGINQILGLLNKFLPYINWPIISLKDGEIKSSIDRYCNDDNRILEFHICPNLGCTAFVGDNSNDIVCRICKAHRFRMCSKKDCSNVSYEDCRHTLKNKISYKSLFYRPIITLISDLLKTEGFLQAIQYSF
jgi:hypothetical protein